MIGYIKGYEIKTISKHKAKKDNFGVSMGNVVQADILRQCVLDALASGGKVYGIFQKKEMKACYIFAKEKIAEADFRAPQIDLSLDNAWEFLTRGTTSEEVKWGDNPSEKKVIIYRLMNQFVTSECEAVIPKFEKAILAELKELMLWGEIKGAIWNEKVLVNKRVNVGGFGSIGGIPFGLAIGVAFGILFDNLAIGISLGVLWGLAMGTIFTSTKK